ncbi:response regulator [Dehalogenimonas etheniformans]|uniref:Response regulatory domain-containing protein n=1 Tax=Dehalogenimonas etheniformans TaxID=1536648 RepID=A0A2P5PA54_9CHLR|nr:hypothetical protein JP09_000320 [Dehalogenimonas etheniformans]
MKVQFVEENPQIFDEARSMIIQHLGKVSISRVSPKDIVNCKQSFLDTNLILFDLDCQNVNSLEIFDSLRDRTRIPIVVLDDVRTGANRLIKALHLGADNYLFKPLSGSHLISTIISYSKDPLDRKTVGG